MGKKYLDYILKKRSMTTLKKYD